MKRKVGDGDTEEEHHEHKGSKEQNQRNQF